MIQTSIKLLIFSLQGNKAENENDAEENGNLTQGDKLNQVKLQRKSKYRNYSTMNIRKTWGQFHQRSTLSFYVRKLHVQLLCAYVLGLYFTGVSLPAQKLHVQH
jgi:hypothetical protein